MTKSKFAVSMGTSALLAIVAAASACSSSDPSTSPTPTTDSGAGADVGTSLDSGIEEVSDAGPHENVDGAAPTSDAGLCSAGSGIVAKPTGSFKPTITNKGANLIEASPGAMICEGAFQAGGGTADGMGGISGQTLIYCYARGNPNYYGVVLSLPAKWKAGDVFAIGKPGSTRNDAGAFTTNREVSVVYEEGPSCGSKQGKARSWTAPKQAGNTLTVDSITGEESAFHLSADAFAPTVGAANDVGTGGFALTGTGTVKLVQE